MGLTDEPIELPKGWAFTTVGEAIEIIDYRGRTPPFSEDGIPHLRSSNIKNGQVVWEGLRFISELTYQAFMTRGLPQIGDVLFTTEAPLGEVALAPDQKFSLAQRMMILRPNKDLLESKFLLYQIKNEEFQSKLTTTGTGSTVTGVSSRNFQPLELTIAPLNEQRRIVKAIDQLRDRSQKARSALSAIPALCDQFRQSVLAAAFRGDLTADWREQNPDIEPASVLLERIRCDRHDRWKETEFKKEASTEEILNDGRWRPRYKEQRELHDPKLPKLPDGWIWTFIEDIADVGTGATPLRTEPEYYENGTISWITSGALNNLFITRADEYITPTALQKTNAKVFPKHTLLVAMYGEGKTRGKVSELLIEAATNQACAALVMSGLSSTVRPVVKLFLQKNYSDIRRLASGGVQPNLNLSMIKNTAIPLPPLQEQEEILQIVSLCMSVLENVEEQYQQSLSKLDYFDRAILAKAFRGELVEQDPTDEPAALLLQRIQAERQTSSKPAKSRKRKATDPQQMDLLS